MYFVTGLALTLFKLHCEIRHNMAVHTIIIRRPATICCSQENYCFDTYYDRIIDMHILRLIWCWKLYDIRHVRQNTTFSILLISKTLFLHPLLFILIMVVFPIRNRSCDGLITMYAGITITKMVIMLMIILKIILMIITKTAMIINITMATRKITIIISIR